ncbi:F5/8 type C domain protein [compost metagenome]
MNGGSTVNPNNYWSEIAAYNASGVNVAMGKAVTSNVAANVFEGPFSNAVDNNLDTYTGTSSAGPVWLKVDLGSAMQLTSIKVAHTSFNDRTYHGTKTEVSSDGIEWHVLYDSAVNGEYPEAYEGKTYSLPSSEPTLVVSFDPRSMYQLRVAGDDKLNEFPVDFTIELVNNTGTVLYTENVDNNTELVWTKVLTPVLNVSAARLIIHRINKGSTTAKIVEFYTAVQETYDVQELVSISLLEEQMFEEQTLPIGNVSSNEIDIRLYNRDGHFNADNKKSPLYGLLKKNRRVKAWLGTFVRDELKWYPLGTFWTTKWDAPRAGLYADLSARDRMELLRTTDFTISQVYVNKSVKWLAQLVLTNADLTEDDYILDDALDSIIIPYAWFNRTSHRDALVQLATVALARTYCNREGQIVMQIFTPPAQSIYTYDDDRSLFNTSFPLSSTGIVNSVSVQANYRLLGAETEVFSLTTPFTVPPQTTIVESFNFNNSPVVDAQAPTITTHASVTMTGYQTYAWGIEITFTNNDTVEHQVSAITVRGKELALTSPRIATAEDAISIRDEGKTTYELLNNNFIQDITVAQGIANLILATYKDPRHDAVLDTRGHITLTLGDRISVPDYGNESVTDYAIIRQTLNWDGALTSVVEAQKIGSD